MSGGPFAGSTVLVTGCRRGIGKAVAIAFADAGANVVGVSATLEADGGAVGEEIEKRGVTFEGHTCDFGDRAAVYGLVEALRQGPPIDILVNNAGTIRRSPAAEHPDEDWDAVLEVNLTAQFVLTREIGRQMLRARHGQDRASSPHSSPSRAGSPCPATRRARAGSRQLTKALANEWAASGVNVNAVAPGYIATDNTQALRDDPVRFGQIQQRIPAGRWGIAADVAGAVLFLASAAADYVHGVILPVDGGWLAR